MSVSSSIGPASGIDYGKLLDGLTSLDQRPIDKLKTRITKIDDQTTAFTDLSTLMTGLKLSAATFSTSAVFRASTATSSNTSILNATAGVGTPVGSYQLTVQQLASASQTVSQGFANTTTPLGLVGNLTFGFGKGQLDSPLKLTELNAGKGVARGSIRIQDRTGAAAVIDLSKAVDVNDVIDAINASTGVNVKATIDGDTFVLTDRSSGSGNFSVSDVGSSTTATDLGLVTSVASNTLTGTDAAKIGLTTSLDQLNNGNGVRTAGILTDFTITGTTGTANISLTGAKTVADVLAKINAATATSGVSASISASGHGITLTDSGGLTPVVAAQNSSNAARDLGLTTGTAGAGTLTGDRINASLASPLLRDLRGGQGVTTGTIAITNHNGVATNVNLSSAKTVADVLKAINSANAGVTAGLNSSGTGILLTDTTGVSSGTMSVADVSGTAAADLGLVQTVSTNTLNGGDAHLRVLSNNTALSTLNAGAGFKSGKFTLTDSAGASFTVDLTGDTITTIGDVITQINNGTIGIKASINANGNGILLTDSAGGTLTPKVAEVNNGTTAASLGIGGAFTGTTLDGSLQKTVAIIATDTLNDVVSKINTANFGASAQIISDGSATPYRLSLVSRNSGAAGNLIFNGDGAGFNSTTLVKGQDAVVLYGEGASTLAATSSSNTISNLIPSLTVTLQSTGTANITVGRDPSKVSDAVKTFVESYNKVHDKIADLTKFDAKNPANNGLLFGDSTVQLIEQSLGNFLTNIYAGVGPLRTIASVGITVDQDGKLSLDENKLSAALTNNMEDVRALFTTNTKAVAADLSTNPITQAKPAVAGIGKTLTDMLDRFINGQTGLIFQKTDGLATQERQLTSRMTSLAELLVAKKNRMIRQFANLEMAISKMQSQGTALSSFKPATTTTSK